MKETSKPEQDILLKLRTMRYLWNVGYFVRRNVPLMDPTEDGRQYTDIDVLGFRISEELEGNFVIGDCKSGVQQKNIERLFWIAGVMKLFGTDKGYFIRSKISGQKYLELTKALGITPLSIEHLDELEKSYNIDTNSFYGAFADEYRESDAIFRKIRRTLPETSNYLNSLYWQDSPDVQIANVVASCKKLQELTSVSSTSKKFLLTNTLALLSLSILRFSKGVLPFRDEEKAEAIELALLGGKLLREERKRLLGGFYDFMSKEIQERYKSKYPISKNQFLESLIPPYSKHLVDFITRLCRNPINYIALPRILDAIAYEAILGKRKIEPKDVLSISTSISPSKIVKPLKDFLILAERIHCVDADTSSEIYGKIVHWEVMTSKSEGETRDDAATPNAKDKDNSIQQHLTLTDH